MIKNTNSNNQGRFITIEGIEGAGKSTHINYIAGLLKAPGRELVMTREPGGTLLGEAVREILLNKNSIKISGETELLLMFAARAQHLEEIIRPALARGACVVCDRFTDSSFAYQAGGRGVAWEIITRLKEIVHGDLAPDITLLFDLPVETGIARIRSRGSPDRFESEQLDFFQRVRDAYLQIAGAEPERMKIINAANSIEEVRENIKSTLETLGLC